MNHGHPTDAASSDPAARQRAADLLWNAWQLGAAVVELPVEDRPASRADGYAIQALLAARSPGPPAGWKIAATSEAGQRHINVAGPLAGRLLAERVHPAGAVLSLAGNRMRVAEAEFVFRMARDLPPRAEAYTQEETMAAVEALHLGIEVPNSRFSDYTAAGAAQLLADDACAHDFVLGPEVVADWRRVDLAAHRVEASVVGPGREIRREGIGANVLGDPRIALVWIANELSQHGIGLGRGELVTTGTCVVPLEIVPGDRVEVVFGAFGRMHAQFAD
ncbi:MAG: hydratase [Comamonadaceae bacterium]|nr:MAG: hydratase [Comamonadaceae bacterium]